LKKNEVQAMTEITFYRQQRRDGSIRSGLELNGEPQFGLIQSWPSETSDDDLSMVLDWYIDLTIQSPNPIDHSDPEQTKNELLKLQASIQHGLKQLANTMGAGVDFESPVIWSKFPELSEGFHVEMVCRASSRITSRQLMREINEFANHWLEYLGNLKQLTVV
jgi:hypothetical protein